MEYLRGSGRTGVFAVTGNVRLGGAAAAPAASWVAGDFIPKAAVTELFPKRESVTVYVKSRIAQLQSWESYSTCLCDECWNVLGRLPLICFVENRLALLGRFRESCLTSIYPHLSEMDKIIFTPVMWKSCQSTRDQLSQICL